MKYAITPKGIGKQPGARAVEDHFPPAPGETFRVTEAAYNPAFVLAEDQVSLREKTQAEIDAEGETELLDTLKAAAIEALIDQSLELEALKPTAPQAVKDWKAESDKGG